MNFPHILAALLVATVAVAPAAWAGEGHDHGDAAPSAVGRALPRFSAVSETFELVGVFSGKQITLYLDRFADNSPVRDAQIELEIGGAKFKAQSSKGPKSDDEYEVVLPEAPKPGVLSITATVIAANETDLLAGELDIHPAPQADKAAHRHSWTEVAGWAVAGIAALGMLVWGGRRVIDVRSVRAGGAT